MGGVQVATAIMAFMGTATERHGISPEDYAKLVTSIIGELLMADAMAQGAPDVWFEQAEAVLGQALANLIPQDAPPEQQAGLQGLFAGIASGASRLLISQKTALQAKCRGIPMKRPMVDVELDRMLANDIAAARNTEVGDRAQFVKNNIPPQLLLDIIHGLHKPAEASDWHDGLVGFFYLGTLMDISQVTTVSGDGDLQTL